MKYNKIFITCLFISMIGSIYAQDNIINEIAKGGKFIVRENEQNEAMVIENGNVKFSGTLKLDVLPKGNISNSIVVWDPEDKLFKILDQGLSTRSVNKIKDESLYTFDYDGLSDDNVPNISTSVQNTASTVWTESGSNLYRISGNVGIGTSNPIYKLDVGGDIRVRENDAIYWDSSTPRAGLVKQKYFEPEIRYKSTINFNVRRVSAGSLSVPTSSNVVFTFDSRGNIGLGTTRPSAKLEVAGQVKITGGTPGLGKVLTSNATGLATWQTPAASGGVTLWTESGNNVYRTNGYIGIGTSNPSTKLDISGQVKITGGTPGLGKVLTSDETGLASWQTPVAGGGSTLWTESGNNVYRSNGKVGIGMANPSDVLVVSKTAGANTGEVRFGGGNGRTLSAYNNGLLSNFDFYAVQTYFNSDFLIPSTKKISTANSDKGNLYITTDDPSKAIYTDRNIITTGNIGIGTTNPMAKLEVAGQVKITGGTPGLGKVLTSDATGLATWQTPAAGGGGSTLWSESGSNVYRTSGNVGIGTTNPSTKLDVNGSAIIGDNTSSSFLHVGDNYNSTTPNSLNPGVYVYKNGLISYGIKLQYTGSEYGTMMFGPNSSNKFLSFGKVGSALEDNDMIEYMRIDLDDGNVGIGTANPNAKLDVTGQVKITGGTPGLGKVLTSDATGLATWQTPAAGGGSTLWTESGSNIYRSSGKVGIGTTNPSAKLDVNGTASAKRYVINGIYDITNGTWDLSQSNLAQVTYNSSITPITINSDGSVGTYVLVVKKTDSCTDCTMNFLGVDVKYPGGVNPTLSSGANTTDIFSFIAMGNNTFYCLYAKNLK